MSSKRKVKPRSKTASQRSRRSTSKSAQLKKWSNGATSLHDDRLVEYWEALSLNVRHEDYRPKPEDYAAALRTHCYTMVEVAYHDFAKAAGYRTFVHKHAGGSHWWLQHPDGRILDPSWPQLSGPYEYEKGRPQNLLPRSDNAREVIRRVRRKRQGAY